MTTKVKRQAQNPLILRAHRLMEAFAKSDDERDFYLDRDEGFIVYVDLDREEAELATLEKVLATNADRYCLIPKLTFYETKKIMEGFVNEKVYDIDTKEKLLDIIQSKEARDHFLDFIYDHHSELEKWQQYYQERWRIRIIEWLRKNDFQFVFEEDLDLSRKLIEKMKECLFETRVGKDVAAARKALQSKAKTYYSNEALNPRPKRGRPPKQTVKLEIEPQVTTDIYTTVPIQVRPFLFTPDITSASSITFSSNFESQNELLAIRGKGVGIHGAEATMLNLNQKLASLRSLSANWVAESEIKPKLDFALGDDDEDFDDVEDEDEDEINGNDVVKSKSKSTTKKASKTKTPPSKAPAKISAKPKIALKQLKPIMRKAQPIAKKSIVKKPSLKPSLKPILKPSLKPSLKQIPAKPKRAAVAAVPKKKKLLPLTRIKAKKKK